MAGDWIKIETTTPEKPEVFHIGDALDIDPDAAVGKLVRVWVWADQQTFDGNATCVTKSLVDRVAGIIGFANAMLSCGWLAETDSGLTFPNFARHNGKTAKTRALTAKRVRDHRNACVTRTALPRDRDRDRDSNTTSTSVDRLNHSSKPPRKRKNPLEYSSAFSKWYDHYPRKVAKKDAAKVFGKTLAKIAKMRSMQDDEALKWLIDRTDAYARYVSSKDPEHIKHPGAWLRDERFDDDLQSRPTAPDDKPYSQPTKRRRAAQ